MKAFTLLLAVVCAAAGVFSAPVSEADYNPLEKRLISLAPGVNLWMTVDQLEEIDRLRHESHTLGVGYFDVTDFQTPITTPVKEKRFFPTVPSHQETVNPLLAQISTSNLQNYITTLSSFQTRYYTTQSSLEASRYLYNLMQGFIAQSGRNDANCTLYVHSWVEPSVICRIEGEGDFQDEIVVTGAHVDSVNSRATPNGVAPGADDDASGVASFVEAFRVLVTSGFKPQRSLEFMAYAAEEVGLRGSQEIARSYRLNQKDVYAVYQNEMSGYHEGNPSIVILQDYVDATLTRFTEALVTEYLTIPFTRAYCGYGCSDHASWNQQTFATVCTAEAGPFGNVNPNMHTDKDTVANLDFAFTTEFAKLGLAFLVELAQFS